jgi:hypothetical protein
MWSRKTDVIGSCGLCYRAATPNGFTENLLELVRHHNDALKKEFKPVVNFLAWPLKPALDVIWAAQHKDALQIIQIDAPLDLKQAGLIKEIHRGGNTVAISGYVWARCLTVMREEIVTQTQARIIMGGKTLNYKGKYPGLLEEALLTLESQKALVFSGRLRRGNARHYRSLARP